MHYSIRGVILRDDRFFMRIYTVDTLKRFISGELFGWSKSEAAWFAFCLASTLVISFWMKDSVAGTVASLTGTCYTLIAGKGKVSCYFFGIINTLLYALISYQNRLFGEVMLNILWYFPMMFAGFFMWKKHLGNSNTINKTSLSVKGRILCYLLSCAAIAIYAFILKKMGDSQPVADSITTILSVTAMVLTVKRCSDQWVMWTVVNAVSVYMWFVAYRSGEGSVAVLLMWILALVNGIIFYIKWKKEAEQCPQN